ncbi:MAG: hypothetical protein ACRDKS_15570 [Actinomycetota bacterium]
MAQQIPFEGSGNGYLIVTPTRDAHVIKTQDFCTGKSSHLGKYSLVAQESIHLETLAVSEGSFTLTAANGDTISGTYAGRGTPDGEPGVIAFRASGPVTGGTGRFAGATGELTFTGVADLPAGELSQSVSGTLSTSGPRPRPKK